MLFVNLFVFKFLPSVGEPWREKFDTVSVYAGDTAAVSFEVRIWPHLWFRWDVETMSYNGNTMLQTPRKPAHLWSVLEGCWPSLHLPLINLAQINVRNSNNFFEVCEVTFAFSRLWDVLPDKERWTLYLFFLNWLFILYSSNDWPQNSTGTKEKNHRL